MPHSPTQADPNYFCKFSPESNVVDFACFFPVVASEVHEDTWNTIELGYSANKHNEYLKLLDK